MHLNPELAGGLTGLGVLIAGKIWDSLDKWLKSRALNETHVPELDRAAAKAAARAVEIYSEVNQANEAKIASMEKEVLACRQRDEEAKLRDRAMSERLSRIELDNDTKSLMYLMTRSEGEIMESIIASFSPLLAKADQKTRDAVEVLRTSLAELRAHNNAKLADRESYVRFVVGAQAVKWESKDEDTPDAK